MKFTIFFIFIIILFCFFVSYSPTIKASGNDAPVATLTNPLGKTTDVPTIIGNVIKGVIGIVGSLALLMFVYGGLLWMTSMGNQEKVDQGRKILIWATAGLVVIFSSYVLVSFTIKSLTG